MNSAKHIFTLIFTGCLLLTSCAGSGESEKPHTPVTTTDSEFATEEASELNTEGNRLAADGKFEEASEVFLEALSIEPDNATIMGNLGNCYSMLDKPIEAKYYLRASIHADPSYLNSAANLANILYMYGEDSARYWNHYVLERTTDQKVTGVVNLLLAYICMDSGHCDSAHSYYQAALNDLRATGTDLTNARKFEETLAGCQ